MGVWVGLCHSRMSEGETCVDAKGKDVNPTMHVWGAVSTVNAVYLP